MCFTLSVFVSPCLSVFQSLGLSVSRSFGPSVFQSLCLPVSLCFSLSVFLSFCLSVFLSSCLFTFCLSSLSRPLFIPVLSTCLDFPFKRLLLDNLYQRIRQKRCGFSNIYDQMNKKRKWNFIQRIETPNIGNYWVKN